jgi:hypothetical protein
MGKHETDTANTNNPGPVLFEEVEDGSEITMCMCKENNWCRSWEETQGGKYPPAEHAPGCDEYKREEFTVLEHDGARCVMELREAREMLSDSEEEYTVSTVLLTRDQFERMSDFQGF